MNEFIEKNRRLLKFYCVVARIIGWALLLLPIIFIIWMLLTGSSTFRSFLSGLPPYYAERLWHWQAFPHWHRQVDLLSLVIRFVLPGLLALGLAQFIRYLFERDYHPGWILRCGEGILYLYAFLLAGRAIWSGFSFVSSVGLIAQPYSSPPLASLSFLLIAAAKAIMLIGLGQALARVMPLLEESKTLV